MVRAFQKIYEKNRQVCLFLVGPFEKELDPTQPENEEAILHHPGICFMDFQKDVRPFLAASDALVFPSYREGFPNVVLQAGASADILVLILPGKDSSLDFRIEMTGQDAQCRLFGLFLCPSDEKVKINVEMLHNAGRCSSHQLFRGIVSGTSRADFYGRIVVAPDAQVTEAYQENHNLLLSDTARIDTQPQLEIYADDVKCSHGAAVGKLNEDEQFYMRSRGLPEDEA